MNQFININDIWNIMNGNLFWGQQNRTQDL